MYICSVSFLSVDLSFGVWSQPQRAELKEGVLSLGQEQAFERAQARELEGRTFRGLPPRVTAAHARVPRDSTQGRSPGATSTAASGAHAHVVNSSDMH